MESRRRQRWDKNNNYNHTRPRSTRRPPRGNWQPTVPSWEKDFCRVVGSLDWETLIQMKKFMHLYDNVIKWNDSAGEEAFCNAKKRFWAKINGLPCDAPMPDPDLYIDKINWDYSETDHLEQLSVLESAPVSSNTEDHHDPVVIFGDSLMPYLGYSPTGWGDNDENLGAPVNHVEPCGPNWDNSFGNGASSAWPGYSEYAWQYSNGTGPGGGYMPCGSGWNNDPGWGYAANLYFDNVGPDMKYRTGGPQQGQWTNNNFGTYRSPRVQWNKRY